MGVLKLTINDHLAHYIFITLPIYYSAKNVFTHICMKVFIGVQLFY